MRVGPNAGPPSRADLADVVALGVLAGVVWAVPVAALVVMILG